MQRNKAFYPCALIAAICTIGSCRPVATPPPVDPPTRHQPAAQQHPHTALVGEDKLAAMRGPRTDSVQAEPKLRIRIAIDLPTAVITTAGTVSVGPGSADLGKARAYTFKTPLRISHDKQGFVLTEPDGTSVRWRLSSLSAAAREGRISLDKHPYPGRLELVALRDRAGRPAGLFDAVNHVGMESYLPGVLSKELYPNWDDQAYRAQAIAARSYAIWEMNLPIRRNSHFDLEASVASQAYIGDKASDKARRAVADTAGQVLVYNFRVLPAFYSSCSGGTGQDAVAAWPGKIDDLAPLRGKDHGGWGQQSSKFRWGPVTRDRLSLSRRIAAWGRNEKHPVASLGLIRSVQTTATNSAGRPTKVRLTDENGQAFDLYAEELRMASNFRAGKLPTLDMTNLVFSSHADYTVSASSVTITGRGFGHGVGLCQFGAQHIASQGNTHRQILAFYYPGTSVQKLY